MQRIEIKLIKPNTGQIEGVPANPRQWKKGDVEKLARSIEQTPELFDLRPIIVYDNVDGYVAIGGNMRLAAAKFLKWKDVPCEIVSRETTTAKLKEIVIKDNGAFGEWDMDALANEWDDLPLSEWGVQECEWTMPREVDMKEKTLWGISFNIPMSANAVEVIEKIKEVLPKEWDLKATYNAK